MSIVAQTHSAKIASNKSKIALNVEKKLAS
jgi:hypothetical protein